MFTILPALALTVYAPGSMPTIEGVERSHEAVALADAVTIHTTPGVHTAAAVERVRELNPKARVWLGAPFNPLVRDSNPEATVRAWAKVATDCGVELLELNGEGSSTATGDWVGNDPAEREQLAQLLARLLGALRDAAPALPLSWTSHDMPQWFAIPWAVVLQEPLALHRPQHYPAEAGRKVMLGEMEERIAHSRTQWAAKVAAGGVDPEFAPYGAKWGPYLQGWGHDLTAITWAMDQAPVASLWASPGSWDDGGLQALRAMRTIRDEVGAAPGAIARWQTARGLDPVGTIGPRSRALLGLPH